MGDLCVTVGWTKDAPSTHTHKFTPLQWLQEIDSIDRRSRSSYVERMCEGVGDDRCACQHLKAAGCLAVSAHLAHRRRPRQFSLDQRTLGSWSFRDYHWRQSNGSLTSSPLLTVCLAGLQSALAVKLGVVPLSLLQEFPAFPVHASSSGLHSDKQLLEIVGDLQRDFHGLCECDGVTFSFFLSSSLLLIGLWKKSVRTRSFCRAYRDTRKCKPETLSSMVKTGLQDARDTLQKALSKF